MTEIRLLIIALVAGAALNPPINARAAQYDRNRSPHECWLVEHLQFHESLNLLFDREFVPLRSGLRSIKQLDCCGFPQWKHVSLRARRMLLERYCFSLNVQLVAGPNYYSLAIVIPKEHDFNLSVANKMLVMRSVAFAVMGDISKHRSFNQAVKHSDSFGKGAARLASLPADLQKIEAVGWIPGTARREKATLHLNYLAHMDRSGIRYHQAVSGGRNIIAVSDNHDGGWETGRRKHEYDHNRDPRYLRHSDPISTSFVIEGGRLFENIQGHDFDASCDGVTWFHFLGPHCLGYLPQFVGCGPSRKVNK